MKGVIKSILSKAVKRKKTLAVVQRYLRVKHKISVSLNVLKNRIKNEN